MLTDAKIRTLPLPKRGRKKYADGGGLSLLVSPSGGKVWYLRKRVDGKEQMINLGQYPAVGLADARRAASETSARLANGLPAKKQVSPVVTFGAVATEWMSLQASRHNPAYVRDITQRLARHILPSLAGRPITEITPREILDLLQQVANGGLAETARRLRQYISRIFRFAVVTERAEHDPAAVLSDALPSPRRGRMAARTTPAEVKAVFRACQYYAGAATVRNALLFQALTAARPGMVNAAEWSEMDLKAAVWTIQADKMKMRRDFRVPLSAPALAILQNQAPISGGHQYVFEGRDRSRPLSGNTLRQALRSMGFLDHVPHGWRAAFSSICNEYGHRADAIELCLAHEQRDKVRAAYNRAELWDERRALMEWWANFLTGEN